MSKECLENCPWIAGCVQNADFARVMSGVMHTPVRTGGVERLVEAAKATYDCDGPELQELEVVTGVFRKRLETVQSFICQHPDIVASQDTQS